MEAHKKTKITRFINRTGVTRKLNAMLGYLTGKPKIGLRVVMGGGSFTDGSMVTVGLSEEYCDLEIPDIYTILVALLIHESQHVVSSNFKNFSKYIDEQTNRLVKEGLPRQFAQKIVHSIGNILEDGRIERISGRNFKGSIKNLQFLNIFHWQQGGVTGEEDNISLLLNIMLTHAKLGIYPKNYTEFGIGTRADEEFEKIKHLIPKAVTSRTHADGLAVCVEVIDEILPFLLEEFEAIREEYEQMQKMMEELQKIMNSSEFKNSEETQTNDGGSGSPIHLPKPSKDESKEQKSQGGGSGEEDGDGEKEVGKGGSGSKKSKEVSEEKENEAGQGKGEKADKDSEEKSEKSTEAPGSNDGNKTEDGEGEGEGKDGEEKSEKPSKTPDSEDGDKSEDGDGKDKSADSSSENAQKESAASNGSEQNKEESSMESSGREEALTDKDVEASVEELLERIGKDLREEATKGISEIERLDKVAEQEAVNNQIEPAFKMKDARKELGVDFKEAPLMAQPNVSVPSEIKVNAAKFKRDVEKIMKSRAQLNLNGQPKGVLSDEDLFRVGMKDYSVFTIEGNKSLSDHVFYILQDGSGSMQGEKEQNSAYALSVIEEGLKGIVPFKITTFSAGSSCILHYVVKPWSGKSKKNYSFSYYKTKRAGGGNEDDVSIRVATAELKERAERDKVLIVLSDGLPSSTKKTKEAIKVARKEGIHVVGIMFGDENFRNRNYKEYRNMYEKNIISTSVHGVPTKLAETLKKILAR